MSRVPLSPILPQPLAGKWRLYEQKAMQIRHFAGLGEQSPLNPFSLADSLGLRVISLSAIEGLSSGAREVLESAVQEWSGATTAPLADGRRVIIINTKQSRARQAATLMEEICHVLLGHRHTRVAATPGALGQRGRVFDEAIEEEAYAVGAAALVPYRALVKLLQAQQDIKRIAKHFGVSQALIKYRMRVLGLASLYKET